MTEADLRTTAAVTAKLLGTTPEEAYALAKLETAYEVFRDCPNGHQWAALERAMLVFQQAHLRPDAMSTANPIEADDVDEAIIQATLCESIDEALKSCHESERDEH